MEGVKKYGTLTRRIGAYLIDCTLLFLGLLVLQALLYPVNPIIRIIHSGHQPTGSQLHLWVFATATLPFLLYFTVTLSSRHQATLGMRLLKLNVVDLKGNRISFGQALLRSAIMLVPFELNHAVMFHLTSQTAPPTPMAWVGSMLTMVLIILYLLTMVLTPLRQSVHDLLAGTIVRNS